MSNMNQIIYGWREGEGEKDEIKIKGRGLLFYIMIWFLVKKII